MFCLFFFFFLQDFVFFFFQDLVCFWLCALFVFHSLPHVFWHPTLSCLWVHFAYRHRHRLVAFLGVVFFLFLPRVVALRWPARWNSSSEWQTASQPEHIWRGGNPHRDGDNAMICSLISLFVRGMQQAERGEADAWSDRNGVCDYVSVDKGYVCMYVSDVAKCMCARECMRLWTCDSTCEDCGSEVLLFPSLQLLFWPCVLLLSLTTSATQSVPTKSKQDQ